MNFKSKVKVLFIYCLQEKLEAVTDSILKDKLFDLTLIYGEYIKTFRDKEVYDIDDISQIAMETVLESAVLAGVDTIIIDGFINIDKINIELIRKIASLK